MGTHPRVTADYRSVQRLRSSGVMTNPSKARPAGLGQRRGSSSPTPARRQPSGALTAAAALFRQSSRHALRVRLGRASEPCKVRRREGQQMWLRLAIGPYA